MAKAKEPAIAFEDDELEAVIAGLVMLERHEDEDPELADAATAALARIEAALPVGEAGAAPKGRKSDGPHLSAIRSAIHTQTKLRLRYVDKKQMETDRTIWPLELGFVGAGETIGAWCESREDFRHFRLDRIVSLEATEERYPGNRRVMMARLRLDEMEWSF